jgi:hypothetical protein
MLVAAARAGMNASRCTVGAPMPRSDMVVSKRSMGLLTPVDAPAPSKVPAPAEYSRSMFSTSQAPTSFMKASFSTSADTGIFSSSTLKRVIEFELRAP